MLCEAQEDSAIVDAAGRGGRSVCAMRCDSRQFRGRGRKRAYLCLTALPDFRRAGELPRPV